MAALRIIHMPTKETVNMLVKHAGFSSSKKEEVIEKTSAIALLQADLADLFYLSDAAQKAGNIQVAEITGACPQRISMVAMFGGVSAIQSAVEAVRQEADNLKIRL